MAKVGTRTANISDHSLYSIPVEDHVMSRHHSYWQAQDLYRDLIADRDDLNLIPVKNGNPVHVHLNLYITEIIDFNQKTQTLEVNVWLPMGWYDERLSWDPAHYGNVTDIRANPSQIWVPDIVLYNPADNNFKISKAVEQQVEVRIFNNGMIRWTPPIKYVISCPLRLKFFPFDVQMCHLHMGSWVHSIDRIVLHEYSWNMSNTEYFKENNIWFVEDSMSRFPAMAYSNSTSEIYSEAKFYFMISRNFQMYMVNVIVSATLMAGLCFLSFFVPISSGERLALPLAICIAISVFQLMAADMIPTGTDTIPILSTYLLCLLIIVVCTIFFAMVSIKFDHYGSQGKIRPPRWLFNLSKAFGSWLLDEYRKIRPFYHERESQINEDGSFKNPERAQKELPKIIKLEWQILGITLDRICMACYALFLSASFISLMLFFDTKEKQLEDYRNEVIMNDGFY